MSRVRGCAAFIGDMPYDPLTPRQKIAFPDDFPLGTKHMQIKTRSISEAIQWYIPIEMFDDWLGRFVTNIRWDAHRQSVLVSLQNLLVQMNLLPPSYQASRQATRQLLSLSKSEGGNPDVYRTALRVSDIRHTAMDHPEIVLALALYQGAFKPFLQQLELAVDRAPIPEQHKDIGRFVLNRSFDPFKSFVIYAVNLPLILLHREEALQAHPNADPEAVVHAAMYEAWNYIFKNDLLETTFADDSIMVCPAYRHLRGVQAGRFLERLYSFVLQHRDDQVVSSLCGEAERLAGLASYNGWYYYWGNRGRALVMRQLERGGQGVVPPKPQPGVSTPASPNMPVE